MLEPPFDDASVGDEHLRLNYLFAPSLQRRVLENRRTFSFWRRYRVPEDWRSTTQPLPRPEHDLTITATADLTRVLINLKPDQLGWCMTQSDMFQSVHFLRYAERETVISTYLILQAEAARKLRQLARSIGVLIEPKEPRLCHANDPEYWTH